MTIQNQVAGRLAVDVIQDNLRTMIAEPMLRERAINALEMAKFKDLPTEKLEKLYNILQE